MSTITRGEQMKRVLPRLISCWPIAHLLLKFQGFTEIKNSHCRGVENNSFILIEIGSVGFVCDYKSHRMKCWQT